MVAEPSSTSLPGTACSWTGAAASPAAGGGSVHSQSAAADAKRGSAAADPEVGGLRSSSRLWSVTRRPDAGQQTSSASCSGRDQRTAHTSAASASELPTTRTQPSSGRSAFHAYTWQPTAAHATPPRPTPKLHGSGSRCISRWRSAPRSSSGSSRGSRSCDRERKPSGRSLATVASIAWDGELGCRYFGVLEGVGNSIAFSLRGANLRKSVPRSAVRSLVRRSTQSRGAHSRARHVVACPPYRTLVARSGFHGRRRRSGPRALPRRAGH